MLRLIDEAAVRSALGMDAVLDYIVAAQDAIDGATAQLSARIRTPLERATHEDTFEVAIWDTRRQFRLSAGFLPAAPTVFWGTTPETFTSAPLADAGPWIWDLEKGVGTRVVPPDAGLYRFVYDAGFVPAVSPALQTGIPTWLVEAAMMATRILMSNNPALKEAGIANDNGTLERALADTLVQKIRYAPSAMLPFAHRVI